MDKFTDIPDYALLAMCVDASGQESLADGTGDGWVRFPDNVDKYIDGLIDLGFIVRGGPGDNFVRPTEVGRQAVALRRPH